MVSAVRRDITQREVGRRLGVTLDGAALGEAVRKSIDPDCKCRNKPLKQEPAHSESRLLRPRAEYASFG